MSQELFNFLCCHANEDAGDAQEAGKGHNQDS